MEKYTSLFAVGAITEVDILAKGLSFGNSRRILVIDPIFAVFACCLCLIFNWSDFLKNRQRVQRQRGDVFNSKNVDYRKFYILAIKTFLD